MKHMSYRKRTMLAGYAFAAPGMIFALLYMGYPMVRSFYLSFTRYNFAFDPKPTFAGLQNYIDMFSDSYFMDALRNTAVFSLAFFPSLMIISLIIALLLDRGLRGSGIYRTCIFMAMVVPLSLTGIIFQWIFNNQYGLLNSVLSQVFGLDSWTHNWLGEGKWAMFSIVVVSLWKNMGMLVILFMAGLAGFPMTSSNPPRSTEQTAFRPFSGLSAEPESNSYVICGLWAISPVCKKFFEVSLFV